MTLAGRPWLSSYPDGVPHTLSYPEVPVYALLDEAAQRHGAAAATHFYGARLTWAQVRHQADAFAAALASLGVQKGDRVAIMLPNIPQTVIAYFGALKAGAVVAFCNPLYTERELAHQLNDSGAGVIVALDRLAPRIRAVQGGTSIRRLILTGLTDYMPLALRVMAPFVKPDLVGKVPREPDVYAFRELIRRHDGAEPPAVAIDPVRDLALLQYTGGTTGLSKGAMLTHRNLVANVWQLRAWMQTAEEGSERILAVMPFFHVYGLTVCLNMAALLAAMLLLVPRFDVKQVLKLVHRERPTLFPGAPTMYVAINQYPGISRYRLDSIRACISGAAPLPVEVQTTFEALTGGTLVEGYGLTEASPVTHCNPLAGRRVPGSIGLPLPDTEVKIVDLETRAEELPPGEVGELCIRGPQVMAGYWNRPEETDQVLRDGWLHTGDVAWMDEAGYTYLVDRIKDVIIAGGYNIYPREVEEVLYEHPAVLEAAVVGVPDEYRGQSVKAFVVPKPGEVVTADEIIGFCRERLAKYKVPREVEFRPELPKSLAGKVLRRELRGE